VKTGKDAFEECVFGAEAIAYVRLTMSYGATLFRLALSRAIDEGTIVAYLPKDYPERARYNFEQGGVWECYDGSDEMEGDDYWNDSQMYVASLCARFLSGHEDACVIFEDYIHDPDRDPPVGVRYFKYKSETYLILQHQDAGDLCHILEVSFNKASQHHRRGLMTYCKALNPTVADQPVSLELLESMAELTSHIIVGAYDEEAELIWSRAGVNLNLG
jgi:hypothetical protein